jgi:hypothetical protein
MLLLLVEEVEHEGPVAEVEPTADEFSLKLGFSWGISHLLTYSNPDE